MPEPVTMERSRRWREDAPVGGGCESEEETMEAELKNKPPLSEACSTIWTDWSGARELENGCQARGRSQGRVQRECVTWRLGIRAAGAEVSAPACPAAANPRL